MAIFLENDTVLVTVKEHGAELASLRSKQTNLEYLWIGDAKYWGRQAPVLFPIVGRLKNDTYQVDQKNFTLGQHDFARDMDFTVVSQSQTKVVLELVANKETKKVYPYDFKLQLGYELSENGLLVSYRVNNPANETMYFGIGGHPAFRTPLSNDESFEDYQVSFASEASLPKIPLVAGLTDIESATLAAPKVAINRDVFKDDALIYDLGQKPTEIKLQSQKSGHGVSLQTNDAKFMGVWSTYPKDGAFVCLEPWWGLADTVDSAGDFTNKYASNMLKPGETFTSQYQITVY